MSSRQDPVGSFEVAGETGADALLAGFSSFGLAGLTVVDSLVEQLDLAEVGHVTAPALPSLTPFEDGVPRHHSRIYGRPAGDVAVLVNELFVPPWATEAFASALLSWTDQNDVDELAVLSGVPVPHGPEDHRVFYVATEDYRDHRLQDAPVAPMGSGFLDGVNASLLAHGMDSPVRSATYVTPVHPPAPDVDAAIRLLETAATVYDLDVSAGPLEELAAEVEQYYRGLAERLDAAEEQQPRDRMYM
ncbi:MAG: proteasome assembly chaperone family protein [Halobacteriaceae archaeon]